MYALFSGCEDPVGVNPAAAALELTPTDTLVRVGDRIVVALRIVDAEGNTVHPLDRGERPRWRVSEPGVAELREEGELEAVGAGAAVVTVTYGALSAEARVRVNPDAVALRVASAYLVQSVQRRNGSIPLVAGREALLRVFVVADQPNFHRPAVNATILLDGVPARSFAMSAQAPGVATEVREGEIGYHARIPADLIRSGASLVAEIDPDGITTTSGSQLRYPESGSLPQDVRGVPPFLLRLVPVRLTAHQTTGRVTAENAAEFARFTFDLYPLATGNVDVRSVYSSGARLDTHDGWAQLVQEIHLLRSTDVSNRYYYGAVQLPAGSVTDGISFGPVRASAGSDADSATLAHELGHNFSLGHAPCGTAASDASFPYLHASIGHYGFNTRTGELFHPDTKDIMGYCRPQWISDYHYEKALAFREQNDQDLVATAEPTLIVWGRVLHGELRLEPLIELPSAPVLPAAPGAYRLDGFDAAGHPLFSLTFDPTPLERTGSDAFLFAVPASVARPDRLDRVILSGPEGTVERRRSAGIGERGSTHAIRQADTPPAGAHLEWSSGEYPLVVVRDRRSGEILALARSGVLTLPGYRAEDLVISASDGVRTRVMQPIPDG